MRKELHGHVSMETAYVVDDYPYGYNQRTKIRYWLEHKPKHGWRLISQTMHPTKGFWNKPKASTYCDFAASMYLDENGHVKWVGLGPYSSPAEVRGFVQDFPHADFSELKAFVIAKVAYERRIVAENKEGRSGWTINGVPTKLTEADRERNLKEYAEWEDIGRKLGLTLKPKEG